MNSEVMAKIEKRVADHLEAISDDLEHDNGFRCPQQLDDVKDCVMILKELHGSAGAALLK